MPDGLIVKALSGFYYVEAEDRQVTECRARGQFKLKGIHPLVGDKVRFEVGADGKGTVTAIEARNNELVRPPIANVDQVLLVFSARNPAPNRQLLDKFLIHSEQAGVQARILFTKCDLLDRDSSAEMTDWQQLIDTYRRIGYQTYEISIQDQLALADLQSLFANRITVLAGQSGVGKSSLLNALNPQWQLQTGEVSQKLGRGKHTTRHVQLYTLGLSGGYIADTPGFSQLDFFGLENEELDLHFVEFVPYRNQCKFRGCSHQHEPACAVLKALDRGVIAASRYESYSLFYRELKDSKRRY